MFCSNCGSLYDDNAAFCPNCGTANANAQATQATNVGNTPPTYTPPVTPPEYNANQYASAAPARPVSFGQRNIALAIVLSIVTCGIYGIYWMIKVVDELNEASNNQNGTSGGMVFLLSLVTCSI